MIRSMGPYRLSHSPFILGARILNRLLCEELFHSVSRSHRRIRRLSIIGGPPSPGRLLPSSSLTRLLLGRSALFGHHHICDDDERREDDDNDLGVRFAFIYRLHRWYVSLHALSYRNQVWFSSMSDNFLRGRTES